MLLCRCAGDFPGTEGHSVEIFLMDGCQTKRESSSVGMDGYWNSEKNIFRYRGYSWKITDTPTQRTDNPTN